MLCVYILYVSAVLIRPTVSKLLDPKELIQSVSSYKSACAAVGYEKKSCSYRSNSKMAVAFHAKMTSSKSSLRSSQVVRYESALLNKGNAYSPSTGKFTAPVDGIYHFDWTTLASVGSYFITRLVRENTIMSSNYCAHITNKRENGQCSSSAIVEMRAGQRVWIRAYSSYAKSSVGGWCYFSGHLLF